MKRKIDRQDDRQKDRQKDNQKLRQKERYFFVNLPPKAESTER